MSAHLKLALFLRRYKKDRQELLHKFGKELTFDDLVFATLMANLLIPECYLITLPG
jgi:hypothetical protein